MCLFTLPIPNSAHNQLSSWLSFPYEHIVHFPPLACRNMCFCFLTGIKSSQECMECRGVQLTRLGGLTHYTYLPYLCYVLTLACCVAAAVFACVYWLWLLFDRLFLVFQAFLRTSQPASIAKTDLSLSCLVWTCYRARVSRGPWHYTCAVQ